jgi:hypothetical protein
MSYNPPPGDALNFSFLGQPAYNPPQGDAVNFSFVPTSTGGGPLALAARAALAIIGAANLVRIAPCPLRAVGAFLVSATAALSNQRHLILAALGRITLTGKRVNPKPPQGLGMKMHVIADPQRPEVVLDQFLRVWFFGQPSAVRVAYQVDDGPEQQPATTWENPNSPQPAVVRIDAAEIPGDGLTHRVTVSAWQQVGTTQSPRASISEYLSTPDMRPLAQPEWCGATLKRQATGLQYHSTGILPDLVEITWRHPGAVAIFAKRTQSGKDTIVKVGIADHQEERFMAEGISALIGNTTNPVDVYLGVAAIARGTYGAITWQAKPIKIKGFDGFQLPATPNPDAATWQEISYYQLQEAARLVIAAQLGASAPANLATIVSTTYTKLIYRIKDVIRKGGTVELDDLGTFAATWPQSGRSVTFAPSSGFKAGTKIGKVLTDAQAKEIL